MNLNNKKYNVCLKRTPTNSMIVSSAGDLERQLPLRHTRQCASQDGSGLESKGMLRTRLWILQFVYDPGLRVEYVIRGIERGRTIR